MCNNNNRITRIRDKLPKITSRTMKINSDNKMQVRVIKTIMKINNTEKKKKNNRVLKYRIAILFLKI